VRYLLRRCCTSWYFSEVGLTSIGLSASRQSVGFFGCADASILGADLLGYLLVVPGPSNHFSTSFCTFVVNRLRFSTSNENPLHTAIKVKLTGEDCSREL